MHEGFLTGRFGEDPDLPLGYKETCCESCDSNVDNADYNVKDDFLLLLEVVRGLREHSSEIKVSEKGSSQLITLKKIIWNPRRQSVRNFCVLYLYLSGFLLFLRISRLFQNSRQSLPSAISPFRPARPNSCFHHVICLDKKEKQIKLTN